jgi:TatD DNase family protein
VRAIAEAHDPVFWAAGTHPMSAADEPMATVDELIALSQHPKFVGIGESGLDYHYTADSAGVQQQSLRIHIAAARETGLPLIIHARDADEDMARILTEEYRAGAYTCVMHCFSSGAGLRAPRSTSASTCRCRASPPSRKATICAPSSPRAARPHPRGDRQPLSRPPPYRGKRNEPAYTVHTARVGAEVFGVTEAEFAAATTANFDRLFTRAARWAKAA